MELMVEATSRRVTGASWLDGQPDGPSDDGYHRECGADQSHVGDGGSGATAPTGLTA